MDTANPTLPEIPTTEAIIPPCLQGLWEGYGARTPLADFDACLEAAARPEPGDA